MCYNISTVKDRRENKMLKWKYEKELDEATRVLLTAYLATSHSDTITVIYTVEDKLYYHDLTENELIELTRVNGEKLMTQAISKARAKSYSKNAVQFATIADVETTKSYFPEYAKNAGYIAEFLYRIKVTNETVEDVKKSNKSISYAKGSDTTDGKQIKNIDKGATFTKFEHLLENCEKISYEKTEDVKKAIEFLTTIYNK